MYDTTDMQARIPKGKGCAIANVLNDLCYDVGDHGLGGGRRAPRTSLSEYPPCGEYEYCISEPHLDTGARVQRSGGRPAPGRVQVPNPLPELAEEGVTGDGAKDEEEEDALQLALGGEDGDGEVYLEGG